MDAKDKNDVLLEQLVELDRLAQEWSRLLRLAQERLVAIGEKETPTTNWESSGLGGAKLLNRFVSGLVGSVDAAAAEACYSALVNLQLGRVGETPDGRVAKAMVAAESVPPYRTPKNRKKSGSAEAKPPAKKKRSDSDS